MRLGRAAEPQFQLNDEIRPRFRDYLIKARIYAMRASALVGRLSLIGVSVTDGVVTLQGTLTSHETMIEQIVEDISAMSGVTNVNNEIVVGFTLGYYKDNRGGHAIDRDRPSDRRQARSLDGGETWTPDAPSGKEEPAKAPPGGIDFTHPDFAARFAGGRFYYSYDRCRTWEGPFNLPNFGRKGLLARTDYLVNGKHDLTAFIATQKDNGGEGWPCAIQTTDGGKTWQNVGLSDSHHIGQIRIHPQNPDKIGRAHV